MKGVETMNYERYLAYAPNKTSPYRLLATYEKPGHRTAWERWFAPHGAREWANTRATLTDMNPALKPEERLALEDAGYNPDQVFALAIPLGDMETLAMTPLPPDPKIPETAGFTFYTDQEVQGLMETRTGNGPLGAAVKAVDACASIGRFKGIVSAIATVPDDPCDPRGSSVPRPTNPTGGWTDILKELWRIVRRVPDPGWSSKEATKILGQEVSEVLRPIQDALPPRLPKPNGPMVSDLKTELEAASDHHRWQLRLLAGLLYAHYYKGW